MKKKAPSNLGPKVGSVRGSFKKLANKITAEERWNLSGRMRPEISNMPNEHVIQDMTASYGMTRRQIVENLLLYVRNIDCIVNGDQRDTVCVWLGCSEPTEVERVQYIKDQMVRSSSGGSAWASLLKNDKIVNLDEYFRLRLKRLDEQVGRSITQEGYRRVKAESQGLTTAGALKVSDIKDIEILRDPSGIEGLDLLGGQDSDTICGFCAGDLVLFAGAAGVGKTKTALAMAAMASSPMLNGRSLYNQGEFDLPTFKRRYCSGVVKGDEDLYISDKRSINDIIMMMYAFRPRWVFLDSKDKIIECVNASGWRRVQHRLKQVAQEIGATVFIISHLNKDGTVKGGTTIQHDVDVVMVADLVKDAPGMFIVWVSKNRAGSAGVDRKATFRHIGNKVLCIAPPPRYKYESNNGGIVEENPIFSNMPESVTAEESLVAEESALLDRISTAGGMEALTIDERKRLQYITEWRVLKDSPETKRKLKEQVRENRRRLKEDGLNDGFSETEDKDEDKDED